MPLHPEVQSVEIEQLCRRLTELVSSTHSQAIMFRDRAEDMEAQRLSADRREAQASQEKEIAQAAVEEFRKQAAEKEAARVEAQQQTSVVRAELAQAQKRADEAEAKAKELGGLLEEAIAQLEKAYAEVKPESTPEALASAPETKG